MGRIKIHKQNTKAQIHSVHGYLQQSEQPGHISSLTEIPLETILEYSNLLQRVQGLSSFESFSATYQECAVSSSFASETTDPDIQFIDDLELNHNFSKAKSRMYLKMLSEFREQFMRSERSLETVLYYATAANECAGKSLDECHLLPVRLSWWNELEVSTRQQRFSFIRLHGTYLTKFLLCLFP